MLFVVVENVEVIQNPNKRKGSKTKKAPTNVSASRWSHLGSNQGPPDYESGALTS